MATVANELKKAMLDGATAVLADIRFDTSADAELCVLPLSWGAATTASPSVATATATADATPTAGTIAKFLMRTGGGATRLSGSVGTTGADFNISDVVIPGGTTSVSAPGGFTLSLQVTA